MSDEPGERADKTRQVYDDIVTVVNFFLTIAQSLYLITGTAVITAIGTVLVVVPIVVAVRGKSQNG